MLSQVLRGFAGELGSKNDQVTQLQPSARILGYLFKLQSSKKTVKRKRFHAFASFVMLSVKERVPFPSKDIHLSEENPIF